jgi:transcription-repair coupling factor (superfamily II helicase)
MGAPASFGLPPPLAFGAPGLVTVSDPPEAALALALANWAGAAGGTGVLHVARSETRAWRLARAASGFGPDLEILVLPPWDCLPYDRLSPSPAAMGRRMAVLWRLVQPPLAAGRLVVTTIDALLQRLPPWRLWADAVLRIEVAQALPLESLRTRLIRLGYILDERVDEPGEAAIRGEVIDLFPGGADEPIRLRLMGERIGAIHRYDAGSQRTVAEIEAITLTPVSEVVLSAETVSGALQSCGDAGNPPEHPQPVADVLAGPRDAPRRLPGLEHRLPLFYDRLDTVFDYLPDAMLVLDPGVDERRTAWLEQVQDAYEHRRMLQLAGSSHPVTSHPVMGPRPLDPWQLYLDEEAWKRHRGDRPTIALVAADGRDLGALPVPRFHEEQNPGKALVNDLRERVSAEDRVVLATDGRRQWVQRVERALGLSIQPLEAWPEIAEQPPGTLTTVAIALSAGFTCPGLTVIASADVDGAPVTAHPAQSSVAGSDAFAAIEDLRPGDHVVHLEHGVGILLGLEQVDEGGMPRECLSIRYAGDQKLLLPAEEIDRLWRYGSSEAGVALDRLSGEAWSKRKSEVEAELQMTAAALVTVARERGAAKAPKLVPPRQAYQHFVDRFPYTETDDQMRAIEAVLRDLASGRPMDRLVCGDVGFGKTEVALRATAAAALAGKQVALAAPTGVLVRQHLETFRRRFAGFDITVESLSRLSNGSATRAVKDGLARGTIDVVIGTHKLASKGVKFHDLGLVIIDEEQRFGLEQKQALRALQPGAHVLTLTATPIPRTLQEALIGIMNLSVIAEAPVRRQPIRTFILPFDPVVVREALLRERNRGGQSFFVCPRIADLEPMTRRLGELAPELDVVVAHGRMKADVLDAAMVAFADGAHDVLLTTNIIEAGLDIPAANTILVWRPDRFGLADLHQLRGRVGRGRIRAVAYLLSDPDAPLAPATRQRLQTLEALEGLGAGLAIGRHDLDRRGAGDLLGADQAGHVRLIGT